MVNEAVTMPPHLSEELHRFSTTTSMKGLPRAAHAQSSGLRAAWCSAVLCFLGLSLYQTASLVRAFLRHEKVTQINEVIFDPMSSGLQKVLPTLSLCNLNPLTSNTSMYENVPTFKEYLGMMNEFTKCDNCSEEMRAHMAHAESEVLSLFGYHQYIGYGNGRQVGQSISDFIVSCHVHVTDGLMARKVPCNNIMTQFTSRPYFNCVNLRFDEEDGVKGDVGTSLVLYLDNFDEEVEDVFDTAHDVGHTSGAIIRLHEAETVPIMDEGETVSPGKQTNIKLSIIRQEELGPPYGTCADLPDILLEQYNISLKNSHDLCASSCLYQLVLEHCGCIDMHLIALTANLSYPFCGDAKLGAEEMLEKMVCAFRIRSSRILGCAKSCNRGCSSTTYRTETHQALWPRTSHLRSFYNHYIADKPYRDKFLILKNLSMTNSPQEDILKAERLVQNNFLKVSLSMKDFRFTVLKDIVKTDLPGLMSQLGGILNLYSGITVFFFIEIIECVYRILNNCTKNDQVEDISEKH